MKILLTGANGLVGQKIKEHLAGSEQVELIATSLHPEVNPLRGGYIFETLDITLSPGPEEIIRRHRPHVVINAAAQANVNLCEQEKDHCRRINTEAVMELTRIANLYGFHLVQISTDFVFDGRSTAYSEEDPTGPVNYYGTCKQEAEDHIIQHAKQWSIIRTVLVYGYFREMKKQNLVTWIYHSLTNQRSIQVVHDQYRMPTLGEDLARTVGKVARERISGIFHICGRELMSIEQIAHRVAGHFGLDTELITPVSSSELNEPAMRPPKTGFNLFRAEQMLNYAPHSFQEGLNIIERQIHNKWA
jgi:dTDP-4-dehydrorhamnose reductase